jgi:2-polyprenyl-3-methyl-5-hydroxy-6-metoxy-1,4-benzoquinol methylase
MKRPEIDWNDVWRQKRALARDPAFWDKRAPEFTRHAGRGDYVGQFISIMKPQPTWRVLDIGSAAGTLAVPLAPRVKAVTAIDSSSGDSQRGGKAASLPDKHPSTGRQSLEATL